MSFILKTIKQQHAKLLLLVASGEKHLILPIERNDSFT